jgi:hypothetical protein
MVRPEEASSDYAGEPEEIDEVEPVMLDDPDRSDLEGLAATDPGITKTGEKVECPWCGAEQELFLEPSGQTSKEEFIEECWACTRDFEVIVEYDASGTPHVRTERPE